MFQRADRITLPAGPGAEEIIDNNLESARPARTNFLMIRQALLIPVLTPSFDPPIDLLITTLFEISMLMRILPTRKVSRKVKIYKL